MLNKFSLRSLLIAFVVILVFSCLVVVLGMAGVFAKISLNLGFLTVDLSPKPAEQSDRPSVPANSNPSSAGVLPQNQNSITTQCPYDPYGAYLPSANTWYGPIGNTDYYLGYNYGFWTWSATDGYQSFPDPNAQIERNRWLTLIGTPVAVCVDSTNHVFVKQIQ